MKDLSIIILSFNTKDVTLDCLNSVIKSLNRINYEIILVDNASSDGSSEEVKNQKSNIKNLKLIQNKENIGFARANNQAAKEARGKYLLFLNSDVIVDHVKFDELIEYFDSNPTVAVLTVKVNLTENGIDPASHRGFPTLWRSFCYFLGLERWLAKNRLSAKIFGGYHLLDRDLNQEHEIDSPSGTFFLVRKNIFDQVKGFDEDFFMYGEDLDLAYRIKESGYKIIYYPRQSVTHLKYRSGLKSSDNNVRRNIRKHFYDAMKIFYRKHYSGKYPSFINKLVYVVIDFFKN